MLYRIAARTGFRVGELASLSPVNFNLDANPPAIALDAKCSKRRKADVQPIRSELAASLGSSLEGKPAGSPVWPGWWRDQAAEMIRADLRRAKARWTRETQNRKERRKRLESGGLARWAALDLDAGESDGHGAAGLADALHAVRCFADRAHAAGLGDALLAARSRSKSCWPRIATAASRAKPMRRSNCCGGRGAVAWKIRRARPCSPKGTHHEARGETPTGDAVAAGAAPTRMLGRACGMARSLRAGRRYGRLHADARAPVPANRHPAGAHDFRRANLSGTGEVARTGARARSCGRAADGDFAPNRACSP
jgi:hypothetical protein